MNQQQHPPAELVSPKRLGCVAGLVGVVGIILGCGSGAFGITFFALTFRGPSNSYVATEFGNSLIGHLTYGSLFFAFGAVPFTAVLIMFHGLVVIPPLPPSAFRQWVLATIVGSGAYWGVLLATWLCLNTALSDLDAQLLPTEGSPDQLVVLAGLGGLGAIMGLASGAALGSTQWLVLRRYPLNAGWWPASIIMGNAMFIGIILALYLWGTRWGWN